MMMMMTTPTPTRTFAAYYACVTPFVVCALLYGCYRCIACVRRGLDVITDHALCSHFEHKAGICRCKGTSIAHELRRKRILESFGERYEPPPPQEKTSEHKE